MPKVCLWDGEGSCLCPSSSWLHVKQKVKIKHGNKTLMKKQTFQSDLAKREKNKPQSQKVESLVNVCVVVPEVQVFRVFQTSIDELFELAVHFWHKLREGKLLGEGKLAEIGEKHWLKCYSNIGYHTSPKLISCETLLSFLCTKIKCWSMSSYAV